MIFIIYAVEQRQLQGLFGRNLVIPIMSINPSSSHRSIANKHTNCGFALQIQRLACNWIEYLNLSYKDRNSRDPIPLRWAKLDY